jgi:hypothetical protein
MDTISLKRLSVVPPIGIRGVENQWLLIASDGNRNKLSVAAVEPIETAVIRKLFEFTLFVWRYRHLSAMMFIALVVPEPLEKRISHARLATMGAMTSVLVQNTLAIINEYLVIACFNQCIDTSCYAIHQSIFMAVVRDYQHIGIDYNSHR